jgi:hypothetical protein
MDTDKSVIGLHRLGHFVPVRRIQWGGGRPATNHRIRVTSRVFELVYRPANRRVKLRERIHVREESVCFHDIEGIRVDLVHAEAGVDVGERRDRGANPAGHEGMSGVLDRAIEGIVDHELVFVSVAEEDIGDDVRGVTGDDLVEVVGGVGERVGAIPAREDVAEDPDALAFVFGLLEFADHPGEVARVVRVGGIDEVEEVGPVPVFSPPLLSGVDTALQASTDNEIVKVELRHPRLFRDVSRKNDNLRYDHKV